MVRIVCCVNLIILNEENKLLLLKRAGVGDENDDFVGYYCIAGGTVEQEETFEKALHREIEEEIGAEIVKNNYFKSFYYVVNDDLHVRAVYFYGKINGEIKLNEESDGFKWFGFEEVKKEKLAFNQNQVLSEFIEFYEK